MIIEAVPYALPLIMVGIVSGGIVFSIWHRRFVPGAIALMLLGIAHALWALGSAFNLLSPNLSDQVTWSYIQYTGVLLLPLAVLAFAIEYAGRRATLPLKVWLLLMVEPLVITGFFLTDSMHKLVGVKFLIDTTGQAPALVISTGILLPLHIIYTFSAFVVVAILLLRNMLRTSRHYRGQSVVLLAGLVIPWTGSIVDLAGWNPFAPMGLAPVLFMFTQLAFLLGVFRYRLLDIVPMARSSLIERFTDGIIVLDEQDRVIDLNRAAKTITGCVAGNVIGKSVKEIFAAECGDLYEYIQTTSEFQTEIRLGEPGSERDYELRVFPLGEKEGSQAGRLVVLHDISPRKELQTALYASEEKYRGVVERSNDGIMIVQDGIIRYSNQSLAKMLGFSQDALTGLSMYNLFSTSDRGEVHQRYNHRLAGEETPSRYESMMITNDGRELDVEINAGLMVYEGRQAVLAFIRNITHHKRSAEELEQSLALLRATIESTADGVLVTGSDGSPLIYNRKFEEMWNLPTNWINLPGHEEPFRLLSYHLNEPQIFLERLHALTDLLDKESTDLIALKDGRVLERYASPYRIGERAAGKVWNFRDVTQQKAAEEQLQRTNARLSETVRELELHNEKMNLLSEMGDLLHSCATINEAHRVVADYARRLFSGQSGAVYMLNGSRNLLEAAARWGDVPKVETEFQTDDCWAMRRGRPHTVEEEGGGLRCQHLPITGEDAEQTTLCLPMIAQGETIGIFHLRGRLEIPYKAWGQVAQTVAESLALSLANLRLRESLQTQSISDPLTGLYNRRYMSQALDLELRRAGRYEREVGLLMIDIDHFKEFNDCYGHKAGDMLLQAFASQLLAHCRAEDYACRYGGEEFLLIFPEAPLEACRERAENLRRGMTSLKLNIEGFNGSVTISVGVAVFPNHGQTAEAVLIAADEALYIAKRSGRNRVAVA